MDLIEDVAKFHAAAEVQDGIITPEALELRRKLVEEESREFAEALGWYAPSWLQRWHDGHSTFVVDPNDVPSMNMEGLSPAAPDACALADAAADLGYVSIGTLIHLFGKPAAHRVWAEVQRANMAKFGPGSRKREDGKQLKPEDWTPPDIAGAIAGTIDPYVITVDESASIDDRAKVLAGALCSYELEVLHAFVTGNRGAIPWGAAMSQAMESLRGNLCFSDSYEVTPLGMRVDAFANHRDLISAKAPQGESVTAESKIDPPHYDGDACMRAIARATKGIEGAAAVIIGQAIKYLWRAGRKVGEDSEVDIAKAVWYLNWRRAHINLSDDRGAPPWVERAGIVLTRIENIIAEAPRDLWRSMLESV